MTGQEEKLQLNKSPLLPLRSISTILVSYLFSDRDMRAEVPDVVRHPDSVSVRNRRCNSSTDRLLCAAVGDPADCHRGAIGSPRVVLLVRKIKSTNNFIRSNNLLANLVEWAFSHDYFSQLGT